MAMPISRTSSTTNATVRGSRARWEATEAAILPASSDGGSSVGVGGADAGSTAGASTSFAKLRANVSVSAPRDVLDDALAHRSRLAAHLHLGDDRRLGAGVLLAQRHADVRRRRPLAARFLGLRSHRRLMGGRVLVDDLDVALVVHRHRAELDLDRDLVRVVTGLLEHLRSGHAGGDPFDV
jgi:hypothetical protein